MKPPLVIYHAHCLDGFTAAWVAYRRFRMLLVEAYFLPMSYGMPFDMRMAAGRRVYLLDFSFPLAQMNELTALADSVVVLDHHQTAEADLRYLRMPNSNCLLKFDMTKSGARLAMDHFFPGQACWLVDYVEDRDLWRWQLPHSKAVNAALEIAERTFESWTQIVQHQSMHTLLPLGQAILQNNQVLIQEHIQKAVRIELQGYEVLAVNATVLRSEIAGALASSYGEAFGACYSVRTDGKVAWSLRSDRRGLDVSVVAKSFGGGGHRHAAGFEGDGPYPFGAPRGTRLPVWPFPRLAGAGAVPSLGA